MKLNLKSTIAAPAGNNSCQKALNGIIGNTRRGIVVDKTLDPDSNNPVANKAVSTALAALVAETTQTFVSNAIALTEGKIAKTSIVGGRAAKCKVGDIVLVADGNIYKISAIDETNITLALPALASYAPAAAIKNRVLHGDLKDATGAPSYPSGGGGGGGGAVSPILNLVDTSGEESMPVPRESITEEEKTNIEKGLYSTVMFVRGSDEILGYLSLYFPGNAINMDGVLGFSAYNLSQKAGGNLSIVSSSFYILNVDEEKNPDGTYPINVEEQLQIPFSITSESIQLYRHFITLAEGSDLICLQLLSFRNQAYDNIHDIRTDILENTQVACTGVVKDSGGTFATPMYLTTNTGVFRVYYFLPTTGEIKSKIVDVTPGRIKVSDWNTII